MSPTPGLTVTPWTNRTVGIGKVGYEINFNREFFRYQPPRPLKVIDEELAAFEKRILELLQDVTEAEKRQALISRAVARGLDPNTAISEPAVPWLGLIPKHWQLTPLRFLVNFVSGATPDTGNGTFWDGDIPWVSPKDMKCDEISDAVDHISSEALTTRALHLIDPGAVLIVVRGMILAHSFPTAVTTRRVTINQDMKALLCHESVDPRFLRDFFRGIAPLLVSLADESAHGTRKLETEVLGRLVIPVPPLSEQKAIVAHIVAAISRLDHVRSATEATVTLLKERRSALITAAVSGQLSIPEDV